MGQGSAWLSLEGKMSFYQEAQHKQGGKHHGLDPWARNGTFLENQVALFFWIIKDIGWVGKR